MNQRIKRGLFLGAGLLVAFGILEAVARFYLGLGTPPLSRVDPEIEYMFRPHQDVKRFGNRQLYNGYGMRNEDFPVDKPPGEIRIVCLGDSVLNGGNLTDHTRLATTVLADGLRRAWNRPVQVANASAGSWGPANMLAYARRYGLFNADQVVVVLSSHDIKDVPRFYPLNPFTHPTKNPCCATWEGITRYVPRYIPALKPILQQWDTGAESVQELTPRECEQQTLDALSTLYEMTVNAGAEFLLVLHAERSEIESGVFLPGHGIFKEWARRHSVDVLDLSPSETAQLSQGEDPYRAYDNIHPSDAGQRLMADQLLEYFLNRSKNRDPAGVDFEDEALSL